jgi:hypothetical protein
MLHGSRAVPPLFSKALALQQHYRGWKNLLDDRLAVLQDAAVK